MKLSTVPQLFSCFLLSLADRERFLTYVPPSPNLWTLIGACTEGRCPGTQGGTIKSANYPANYPDKTETKYILETDKGSTIQLLFEAFTLEDPVLGDKCDNDFLKVIDSDQTEIAILCGGDRPPPFRSKANNMTLIFYTDESINMQGFQATWKKEDGALSGEFKSPNYPNKYPNNVDETEVLSAPKGSKIELTLIDFHTEGCCDYLLNSSHLNRGPYSPSQNIVEDDGAGGETEKENNSLISHMINKDNNLLSTHFSLRDKDSIQNHISRHDGLLKEGYTNGSIMTFSPNQCKVSAINLSTPKCSNTTTSPFNHQPVIMKQENLISIKEEESLDLTVKTLMSSAMMSPDHCESPSPPHSASQQFQMLTTAMLPTSSATPLNLLSAEGATAADQMAALLGPDQMAALLGPSWKSRQPRMCQYCQRMFSNKFNLKQHILNMHTVGRELQCEICQKKVKNKWYLRRHHVTHHGAPLKK